MSTTDVLGLVGNPSDELRFDASVDTAGFGTVYTWRARKPRRRPSTRPRLG